MTAEDLADLIQARKVGRREWRTNCPVHDDCDGLLRIVPGNKEAAYIACFKHCSFDDIVARLGIPYRELFSTPEPAPDFEEMSDEEIKQYRAAQRERQAKHLAACEQLHAQKQVIEDLRQVLKGISAERRPQKLMRKWQDARRALRTFQEEERRLRAPGTCPTPHDKPSCSDWNGPLKGAASRK